MKTTAFIDASNLFYGGEKSLGWKIDYQKLLIYLKKKYEVQAAYYFGGVEVYKFPFDYLTLDTVPLPQLEDYLNKVTKEQASALNEAELLLMGRHLQRVRFYRKLEDFGYNLVLKPVKQYQQPDGRTERKANCDVDLAFYLMREQDQYEHALVLSGDGDFLPVLKYLRQQKKKITILSRGPRTAREIRLFAGSNFRDFVRLEKQLKFF